MCDEYNGWTNRETWALNLWLSNDQGLYEMTRERVAEAVNGFSLDRSQEWYAALAGETVKAFTEELFELSEGLMSAENIISMLQDVGSLYRVNWDEIGAAWLPEEGEWES